MVNIKKKYSCSFIYNGKKELLTLTKMAVSGTLNNLIENNNVTNFYFFDKNLLEDFAYFFITNKKQKNSQLKRKCCCCRTIFLLKRIKISNKIFKNKNFNEFDEFINIQSNNFKFLDLKQLSDFCIYIDQDQCDVTVIKNNIF